MEKLKELFYQSYIAEAKAALRLKVYADKAEKEGYTQIAKLFKAIASSEEIHGTRSLREIMEIKSTEENLSDSFESEKNVAEVAYDEFLKKATQEDDSRAIRIFSQTRDVEDSHAKLYKEAMNHMLEDRETTYYICDLCGFISDGILPDKCPVCGAKKEKFKKLE